MQERYGFLRQQALVRDQYVAKIHITFSILMISKEKTKN
jgi:hypothetical protein